MRIRRYLHTALMAVLCATLLSSSPAFAQFTQQGSKLVGSDGTSNAAQGTAVADGISSRVFNVTNGVSALTRPDAEFRL
jgi:hypothetical protein